MTLPQVQMTGRSPESNGRAPKGSRVQTLRELSATELEPVEGLWGPWLVPGEMASVASRGGMGKTTFTRGVMCRAAQGGSYLGQVFARPLSCIYFSGEGSAAFWRSEMERTADTLRLSDEERDRIHIRDGGGDCGLKLSRPGDVDELRRDCDAVASEQGLDVGVWDPFSRFMVGDENASTDMGRSVESILELQREFGIATWVPHHASQAGRGLDAFRGHTTFEGAIATGFVLTAEDGDGRKLDPVKVRYAQGPNDTKPRHLRFDHEGRIYVEDEDEREPTTRQRLLDELNDGAWHKVAALADRLGIQRQGLSRHHIDPMVANGKLESEKREHGAQYVRLPQEGVLSWDF